MKKTHFTTTALILAFLLSSAITIAQSTETRNLTGFSEVSFGVPGNLNIRIGSEFKVTLEGDKDFIAEIITNVSNGKLTIRTEGRWKPKFNNKKVIVNITMPAISGLSISGSGTAEVFDSFKTGSLSLAVSGSGRLILNDVSSEALNCSISGSGNIIINNASGKELRCSVSGSGNITLKGNDSFSTADISMSGSGKYNGESLKIETAKIRVAGSGNCNCHVTQSLEASVTGSGKITYVGNPTKIDTRTTGSGKISSK